MQLYFAPLPLARHVVEKGMSIWIPGAATCVLWPHYHSEIMQTGLEHPMSAVRFLRTFGEGWREVIESAEGDDIMIICFLLIHFLNDSLIPQF